MIDDDIRVTDEEAQAVAEANIDAAVGETVVGEDAELLAEGSEESSATSKSARLVVKRAGAETEDEFALNPPAVIGRFDPDVGPIDVDLGTIPEGSYVSRKHARIVHEDDVWSIQDLGSSNGTFLLRGSDFERVEEAELQDGDEIALGNARLVFRVS